VERYFDNELSASEVQILNERLKTDLEFRSIFDQERALIGSIRASGLRRDLLHLKEVEKEILKNRDEASGRRGWAWYYSAAAATASFIVPAVWLIPQRDTLDHLFQAYFVPVVNAFETTKRGASETAESPAAYQHYDAQNFQAAAEMFGELLKETKE